ncbi:MAG: AbrB/MazE/SpoVT family DNA-binding domain-containing protein [Ardenticatenia bacterium]|nr:AbrB/MazE/SpoVT family DNA-binding domain-containing protein [Ardenticatenia bacterium]
MSSTQTARIVELSLDYQITLPAEVAQKFRPADRFFVWPQGDTLILKRITIPRVTEIVAMTPETQPPLALEEIDEIVHEVRRQRAGE